MNILKPILKTVATSAIVLASYSSHGAMVNETLTGTVLDGDFAGTVGTGSFSYDDSLLTFSGTETLNSSQFSLTFTIFGQTFGNSDDVDFPDFPELTFQDGLAIELDFVVVDMLPTDITQAGVNDFGFFELLPAQSGTSKPADGFETIVTVNQPFAPVPVPASIWLFASGIIGLIGVQRRKA